MFVVRTTKHPAHPLGKLVRPQQTVRLDNLALCVDPLRHYGVRPRTLPKKKTTHDSHSLPLSLACLSTRRAVDRRRRWTGATDGNTMERHGLFGPIPRLRAGLPQLALPMLRAPNRCPLRAYRRATYRGSRTLSASPKRGGYPSAPVG